MSTTAAPSRAADLSAIVGGENVAEAPATMAHFSIDGVTPSMVVTPGSVEEIASILRYAYERDLVVVPAGGFTHQEPGRVPHQIDIVLRLERLNSIEHYDPGDLTIGVGAGTTIGEIEGMLRDQGQMLPLDIAHIDRVTLGGAMAVAASGPLKHFYGGLREFCLGVRYITADGKIAKAGARVVKNVAGFDVMKLLIGSYGTLAVITSASFKLFPLPAATRTFVCEFSSLQEAMACRDAIVDSPLSPICLEVLSPRAYNLNAWTVAVRAGGSERVLNRYAAEIGSRASKTLTDFEEQKFWNSVQILGQDSPVVMRVSVPPSIAGQVLADAQHIANENRLGLTAWGRVGISSLLVAFDGGMAESYVTAVDSLRRTLPRDASAVVSRCPSTLKNSIDVWGASPSDAGTMKAIKHALDPKDILNRGRFLF
ncbi:MAG TPA: FAD-binding oxidoreductase [Terriglobales bacterium]|nr:FAD-binding oxidoreductase [Terriglobales bacterium]